MKTLWMLVPWLVVSYPPLALAENVREEAQQRVEVVFRDPTFPDTYYPGYDLFKQKILDAKNPGDPAILEAAAKAMVLNQRSLTPQSYQNVSADLLKCVDAALDASKTAKQSEVFTYLFDHFSDTTNDMNRFYLKPSVFEAIRDEQPIHGLTDTGVDGLLYLLKSREGTRDDFMHTVQWFPGAVAARLKALSRLNSPIQLEVLRTWDRPWGFSFPFRTNSSAGHIVDMIDFLPNVQTKEQAVIAKLMGETHEKAIRDRGNAYQSMHTRLQENLTELFDRVKPLPGDPFLRYAALGIGIDALGHYYGGYIRPGGTMFQEDMGEVLKGTGVMNEFFTHVNRVQTPGDLALLQQLVFTRVEGKGVVYDARWLTKLGQVTVEEVAELARQYKPNTKPFSPEWVNDPFGEKKRIALTKAGELPWGLNPLVAVLKFCRLMR